MKLTRRAFIAYASACAATALCGPSQQMETDPQREPEEGALEEAAYKALSANGTLEGISTGFSGLDSALGGLRNGSLVVLAGRLRTSQTSLALDIATRAAQSGTSVMFFSLELSKTQIMHRILNARPFGFKQAAEENITNLLAAQEWKEIAKEARNLAELPLWIDDSYSLSVQEIRERTLKAFKEAPSENRLIIVDYLQLVDVEAADTSRYDHRIKNGQISFDLKQLGRELDAPVLALSHLSRRVDNRPGQCPELGDLRDLGIEQDPDVALLLRHAGRKWEMPPHRPQWDTAELIVAKNRYGKRDITVPLSWNEKARRFDDFVPTIVS